MSESLTTTASDISSLSSLSPAPSTPSTSPTLELADPSATQTSDDFFSSSFPSPPATETPSGNNSPNFATTSSLYLFTFLATLLLLLAISCAIVVRSLIIRRRFQRRVQEALAEGIVLPPQAAGDVRGMGRMGPGGPGGGFGGPGGRRRFGEKPKMWDAHLAPPEGVSNESKWEDLMPVSVRIQHDKLTGSGQQPPTPSPPRQGFLHSASLGFVNNQNWRPRFFRSRRPSAPSAPSSGPDSTQLGTGNNNADASQENNAQQSHEPTTRSEDAQLQVSVLIAMPSPYRPRVWRESLLHGLKGKSRNPYGSSSTGSAEGDGEEDEELPVVVLGTVEMPWKVVVPNHRTTTSPSASDDGSASGSGRGLDGDENQSEIQMHTLRPRELNAPFTSASGAR